MRTYLCHHWLTADSGRGFAVVHVSILSVQKATHTNQYLSFDSHHPVAHKAAVVRILMHRASTLSSNSVERVTEEKKVMKALRANGYPSGFIHWHLDNRTPR